MQSSTKVTLVNNLSTILQNAGIKQVLYNHLMQTLQLKAIHDLKQIKQCKASKIDNPKKIIFHCVHGQYFGAIYRELAVAKMLQLKGHRVEVVFCGGKLDSCTGCFTKDNPPNKGQCKNCIDFSKKFADVVGLPYSTYDDYLRKYPFLPYIHALRLIELYQIHIREDNINNVQYKNVKIGTHAQKSTDRYFKGEQPPNENYLVHKLVDAATVVDVAEQILLISKPDIIVTSHSIYAEWGSFSEFFKNYNIPVYTWFAGNIPGTLVFNFDELGKDFDTYFNNVRHQQYLTYREGKELRRLLEKRKKGYGDTALYTYTQEEKVFDFSDFQKVYAMFPNVPWDIDSTNRTLFFDSTYKWIDYTIELFRKHPECLLIIKTHPYERVEKSQKSVYDYVIEKYPDQKNLVVIPADSEVSSYDLFPYIDAGIVSNSTTGLEMLITGIPVITVGEAHYRGKGFTYDPKTKKQYEKMLFSKLNITRHSLVSTYIYYYFIKSYIPLTFYYRKNFLNIGWNIKDYEEFLKNKELNHIANYILGKEMLQDW